MRTWSRARQENGQGKNTPRHPQCLNIRRLKRILNPGDLARGTANHHLATATGKVAKSHGSFPESSFADGIAVQELVSRPQVNVGGNSWAVVQDTLEIDDGSSCA
ncbi:hypothetical protein AAFF_G00417580 [Aldrovandia affinis]|uniref:Uncharacterized protein n=1 Tax=Aldrovandia affinis TaxID=143900 RepID=A0AAD7WJD7_9TELE|nr:hypothetical protein AAFF_G00417580 [Aldrovandia affinis]